MWRPSATLTLGGELYRDMSSQENVSICKGFDEIMEYLLKDKRFHDL